ncbi:hypothetical protein [Geodermatophilus normandii]|uniref:Uncharacterized protein n=1 Tax=Geodermatophilus normandii TaxID=1137989 RepID=A0A6P0GKY7_9ACTN|nr:hypothetical protein [Geodermatophilus normandii]NEM08008.1 hypothetical protein [Geodermatophilus normandii]
MSRARSRPGAVAGVEMRVVAARGGVSARVSGNDPMINSEGRYTRPRGLSGR